MGKKLIVSLPKDASSMHTIAGLDIRKMASKRDCWISEHIVDTVNADVMKKASANKKSETKETMRLAMNEDISSDKKRKWVESQELE
uniref:Uncharacterized protein n=1 Tax=Globisporangium ultimum (strain ATCC 200006 / CBS 805.95 / DAOM BR144) TaxID=431595 RepID=K3W8C2_GLOUD